jgi:hypothetical protein
MEDDLHFFKMEDDLNLLENGRGPQFLEMEDDLKNLKIEERKTTSISLMEDDFKLKKWNFLENGRRPYFCKCLPTAQHITYFQPI